MRKALLAAAFSVAMAASAAAQSTFGETLREARLELDIGNPGAAATLYERALAMRPSAAKELAEERAWAYLRVGNNAMHENDFAGAESAFTLAAALQPDLKGLFLPQWVFVKLERINDVLAQASEEKRDANWTALKRELNWVLDVSPGNKRALYFLGIVSEITKEPAQARGYYAQLLDGEAKDLSLDELRRRAHTAVSGLQAYFELRPVPPAWLLADDGPFETYRHKPFVIYHHNRGLAERIAAVLEYHLSRDSLAGVLEGNGPFVEECAVYVFADEEAYREAGGGEMWAGGQAKATVSNGRLIHAQIHLHQAVPELTESAVPHELAHVRLLASVSSAGNVPLWLQEGVATSQESAYKKEILARAVTSADSSGHYIRFQDLLAAETYPQNSANEVFYGESVAAVESLVEEYGRDRFTRFVKAAQSQPQPEALARIYELSPTQVDDLIRAWAAARQ